MTVSELLTREKKVGKSRRMDQTWLTPRKTINVGEIFHIKKQKQHQHSRASIFFWAASFIFFSSLMFGRAKRKQLPKTKSANASKRLFGKHCWLRVSDLYSCIKCDFQTETCLFTSLVRILPFHWDFDLQPPCELYQLYLITLYQPSPASFSSLCPIALARGSHDPGQLELESIA